MSTLKNRKAIAVASLVCQLASLAFWQPTHFHLDFFSGPAQEKLIPHADADHCKHLPLSDDSQCTICLSAHSRISVEPVSVTPGSLHFVGRLAAADPATSAHHPLLDSFYRRGPPFLLG